MQYHFAGLSLDIDRQILQRSGQLVKIRPKVFHVLAYLIEHRDRVVSKDELMQELWPDRFVSETTLTSCLKELRQAVGDSGRQQQIVQTLHGRGYRFVAELASPTEAASEQKAIADIPPERAPVITPPPTGQKKPVAPVAKSIGEPVDEPIGESVGEPVGEHKIVSVLSCGLHNAASVFEQFGSESMDQFMQVFFSAAQSIITRFDGTITQWLGDGFVALFGAPRAHEDHARRAVLAALELIRQRPAAQGRTISLCVGVHSGSVVISHLPHDPQRLYTALGETTRSAEKLQRRAGADILLISAATHEYVRADVRSVPVDDATFRVEQALTPRAGVPRRLSRTLTPLVGRCQELDLLHERLRHVEEGQGQVVAIIGEPGIGKSRVLHEFRNRMAESGVEFYQTHCVAHGRSTPYLPLLELLRQFADISEESSSAAVIRKLRMLLKHSRIEAEEGLPLLLQLLDIPYDAVPLSRFSPQAQRERTLGLLQRLVVTADRTRVVALEDLHWIDATTQEWLSVLVRQLTNAPVLLLLSYRPEYAPPWLAQSHVTQLVLPRLTQQDSLALLRSLPRASAIEQHWQDIVVKGSGNPFFLEELVWNIVAQRSTIPDTVQGVLAARIDALPGGDKKVLQTAAVIGVRVLGALLGAVCEQSEAELAASLARLQSAELLFEDYAAAQPEYVFKHVLAQEVAYRSLLSNQRQAVHARLAEVLQARFADTIAHRPDILAQHYHAAGNYAQAVEYWQQAGRYAYERSAYSETMEYVQKGLQALAQLSQGAERERKELRLQTTLGPALMAAKGYGAPEVESAWTRARHLAEQLGDAAALFRVLIGLSNYYWVQGRFGQAYATNRQLLKLARRARKPAGLLRAHAAMGELLVHAGRLRAAHRHIEGGVKAYFARDQQSFATQTPAVACLCYAAWSWWQLGYDQRALQRAEQALALAQELAQPFSLAVAQSLIAELHQFRWDTPKALELARAGAALAHEQGFPFWESTALVLQGWAEAQSGQTAQGVTTVQRGLALFRTTHAEVQLSSWYGLLAESYACDGQIEAGLEAVSEALQWAGKTDERYYEAELYRLRGAMLAKQGEIGAAETALQHSMQLAERRAARFWQLRAACDLAVLWWDQGRSKTALALLKPLYERFDEGFDAPDLRRARDCIDRWSTHTNHAHS